MHQCSTNMHSNDACTANSHGCTPELTDSSIHVCYCPAVGVVFDYMEWRTTGTTILRGLDDIQQLLDDQIVKTQSMRASPYIGPFEDRVRLWSAKLNLTQEIIDEWLKCQQVGCGMCHVT